MNVGIILGDQLWRNNPILQAVDKVIMIESLEEAKRLPYHKFKLTYVYTLMREYRDFLQSQHIDVEYYSLDQNQTFETVLETIQDDVTFHYVTPHDKSFQKRLKKWLGGKQTKEYVSPAFLTPPAQFKQWVDQKSGKRLLMADFYQVQRRKLGILMTQDDKPVGGNFSYDQFNRQPLRKNTEYTLQKPTYNSKHWPEVADILEKEFPNNPGIVGQASWLPLNHVQAQAHLKYFIQHKLELFGPYEDALTTNPNYELNQSLSIA
jgi:deoxyribodipyrimidine photolyase-related protein